MENSFAAVNYGQVNTTTNNGAGQRTTTKRNQQQLKEINNQSKSMSEWKT